LLLAPQIVDGEAPDFPVAATRIVKVLSQQALETHAQLREIDRSLVALQRTNDVARTLATIPGIGPLGTTEMAASVTDPGRFRSGRPFAAWLGWPGSRTRAEVRSALAISPRWAIAIYASFSSSARHRWRDV
jgi:transposase